jgi:hypothetical protein
MKIFNYHWSNMNNSITTIITILTIEKQNIRKRLIKNVIFSHHLFDLIKKSQVNSI